MINEFYWFILLIFNFSFIMLFYRLFGKAGLFAWIPISNILANAQVVIYVKLFGFESATLGNILYAGGFLITDILSENYSKKDGQKAVWIGFFSMIATTSLMNIALMMKPNMEIEGNLYDSVKNIFSLFIPLFIASLSAYFCSQHFDVFLYHAIKKNNNNYKTLWIRNNFSTMLSQALDSSIFCFIATILGVFPKQVALEIFISTYVIKFAVAICDTGFLYIAKIMHQKKMIPTVY